MPAATAKFLGVLDLDVRAGKVADVRYRLLPVFSNLIDADPAMSALIEKLRAAAPRETRRDVSRPPKDCSTAAAISTARWTS
jgi:2',3'-cyclic-nucleotide 2'-phosphodiesterase (5'-nucleotidase family)